MATAVSDDAAVVYPFISSERCVFVWLEIAIDNKTSIYLLWGLFFLFCMCVSTEASWLVRKTPPVKPLLYKEIISTKTLNMFW